MRRLFCASLCLRGYPYWKMRSWSCCCFYCYRCRHVFVLNFLFEFPKEKREMLRIKSFHKNLWIPKKNRHTFRYFRNTNWIRNLFNFFCINLRGGMEGFARVLQLVTSVCCDVWVGDYQWADSVLPGEPKAKAFLTESENDATIFADILSRSFAPWRPLPRPSFFKWIWQIRLEKHKNKPVLS